MSGSNCTDNSPGHTGTQALTAVLPTCTPPRALACLPPWPQFEKWIGQSISRKAFPTAPTEISPLHSNFPYTSVLSGSLDIFNANQNKSFHFRHAQMAVFHGQRAV